MSAVSSPVRYEDVTAGTALPTANYPVTAPSDAECTSFVYFARTPRV